MSQDAGERPTFVTPTGVYSERTDSTIQAITLVGSAKELSSSCRDTTTSLSGTTLSSEPDAVPQQDIQNAIGNIESIIRDFNYANGLCIVISCEQGHFIGTPVPGIHKSAREFKDVFNMFGYATYHLKNPTRNTIMALYRALATGISYPPSFKRLVFFYTGHGFYNHISVEDENINIYDVITHFWSSNAPEIAEIPKIFIFDCCRTDKPDWMPEPRSSSSVDSALEYNIYILYTALPQTKSYTSDGVSIPTTKLVEILKDRNHIFSELHRILQRRVQEECNSDVGKHMSPVTHTAMYENIHFHEEREEAMKPTHLRVHCGATSTTISWVRPRHAKEQHLRRLEICINPKWHTSTTQKVPVSCSSTSHVLPSRDVENCRICIQATYKDDTVVCSDYSPVNYSWNVKRLYTRCKEYCSLWWFTVVTAAVGLLFLALLAVTLGFVIKRREDSPSQQLIVAGDIITHPKLQPSWLDTLWYRGVFVEQVVLPSSDDLSGFPVAIVKSSQETKVVTQRSTLTGLYLPSLLVYYPSKMVQFPENYNNWPLYFVRGSVISFELLVNISLSTETVQKAQVCIFDNLMDSSSPEELQLSDALTCIDATAATNKNYRISYTVMKNSYLFFAIKVDTSANSYMLLSNLTFKLVSLSFAAGKDVEENSTISVDHPKNITFAMFSPPKGIYLYAPPIEDNAIHLVHLSLRFENRTWFRYILVAIFSLVFIICGIIFIVGIAYKFQRKICRNKYERVRTLSDVSQSNYTEQ